ncbi:SDR family NAD(P)-dependent oxidoreductase [Streptantibioticus silvisoli]|uniref:SDR family NAD(P)-dependent oxidoreductase n=1 Tax=Streptantibioticus silvisoli TaxID=2705255 RepID=A0ABT6VZA5_9ACTN|nr:SDR family NAD(P)-dependent oxidoreductase [Streptantibioticus silvisoli]MDI5963823.1 SDR family NAD(P)-dependent oxidoreductase [Streptantibioticus silvisoli]
MSAKNGGKGGRAVRRPVALVTGASRGLGLLIARELARRGCRVMLCARDGDELRRAERELLAQGGDVRSLACDLTAPDAPAHLVGETTGAFGGIDVLVNNAGIIQVGPLAAAREADFRQAAETMYFAPLRLTLAALPYLCERRGRLVTIASVGGKVAPPHLLPYAAAKFAVTGLSEGLRAELAGEGVSVTTVVPGLMRTGSHTAARFSGDAPHEYAWFAAAASLPLLSMDAERAARAVVRAAWRRRPEVVLTPAAKVAVRLQGLAPATTTRLMTLAARLLPAAGAAPEHDVSGAMAARRLDSPAVRRLTVLGDRAGRRFNQDTA